MVLKLFLKLIFIYSKAGDTKLMRKNNVKVEKKDVKIEKKNVKTDTVNDKQQSSNSFFH